MKNSRPRCIGRLRKVWCVGNRVPTRRSLPSTKLKLVLGKGEAACLAMAQHRGWVVACDERRAFLREARRRVGETRLLNTPGLILLAIRQSKMTVEEADEAKKVLETRRFRMKFRSFGDLL